MSPSAPQVPAFASARRHVADRHGRRALRGADPLELSGREEAERIPVGRPEERVRALGAADRPRFEGGEVANPDAGRLREPPARRCRDGPRKRRRATTRRRSASRRGTPRRRRLERRRRRPGPAAAAAGNWIVLPPPVAAFRLSRARRPPRAAQSAATAQGRIQRPAPTAGRRRSRPRRRYRRASASCSPTSCAVCQRASGSFARHTFTRRSSAGGLIGRTGRRAAARSSGSPRATRLARPLERLSSGRHLVERGAEREDVRRASTGSPLELLGRHVRSVPTMTPSRRHLGRRGRADLSSPPRQRRAAFARPKSSSFAPDFVSMTLAGFRSRWTMPFRCAAASAAQISAADPHQRLGCASARARVARQRLPFEQLGDGVGTPFVGAEVEDRQDVRMRQRRDRVRLALERASASGRRRRAPAGP